MKIMSIVTAVAVLGSVCFASIAAPASAQGASESSVSISVKSRDLDLSRPEGATVMLQRIHNAAAQICGPAPTDRLAFGRQYNACMKQSPTSAARP
jgi:UrcA family protein